MYRDSGRNSICHLLNFYKGGGQTSLSLTEGLLKVLRKAPQDLGVSTWQQRLYSISTSRVILHHQPSTAAAYATLAHTSSYTSRVYSRAFADYCIHVFSHSVYGTKGLNLSCESWMLDAPSPLWQPEGTWCIDKVDLFWTVPAQVYYSRFSHLLLRASTASRALLEIR